MHPCAQCARVQQTCCQRAEILLTREDVRRIGTYTGRADFYEFRPPTDPAYLEHDEEDPNWLAYTFEPDGTRRILRKTPDGCTFLGAEGCTLPEFVRPLVCRLYPFKFTERGITGEAPDYCPTRLFLRPGAEHTMITVLGMSLADGQKWHEMLYRELRTQRAGADSPARGEA